MKKWFLGLFGGVGAVSVASAQMTTDIETGLSTIEGYADSALLVAVTIGGLVIGWMYIKRLVKKG